MPKTFRQKLRAYLRDLVIMLAILAVGMALILAIGLGGAWFEGSGGGGAVSVGGHTKKDGTRVKPHTRRAPSQ